MLCEICSDAPLSERRVRDRKPFLSRVRGFSCFDLDDIAVLKLSIELYELVVHLYASNMVADFGVDGIGKINGRGARWQIDDVAVRGEHEDSILKEILPHVAHEFVAGGLL